METAQRKKEPRSGVPAFRPSLTSAESAALVEAVDSGWLGTGIYTRLFESRLSAELGGPSALATNSGTAALHLALHAFDVRGREVITTPVTSVATNHAILHNGGIPVFCDVDPETGNLDPAKLPALVTPRTRAIVAVHLGAACDMDPVLALAKERGVLVLEDACAVLAARGRYKGRALGTLGDAACFSFGRFKGLTTVDGGALVHRRAEWRERLARLRRLGHKEEDGRLSGAPDGVAELGYHYRMSDLAAVVGLAQFSRLAELAERLRSIAARYREGLAGLRHLRFASEPSYSEDALGVASVRVPAGRRDALRRHLEERGVQVNDPYFPSHLYDLYRPYRRALPAAERYCEETLPLPCYPALPDASVERVLDALRRFRG